MTAGDLAAVLVAVLCLVAVAVLCFAAVSMIRTVRSLRSTVDVLREQTLPMVVDLRETVQQASVELDRVDELIDTAESISTTVDSASRLTFRALSPPIIKTMSVFSGAQRATRRLRGKAPDAAVGPAASDDLIDIEALESPRRQEAI